MILLRCIRVGLSLVFVFLVGTALAQSSGVSTLTASLNGIGTATITLDLNTNQLCYHITVPPGTQVQQVHLHAPNGTIAALLGTPDASGQSGGCFGVQASLIEKIILGGYEIDVHSTTFPTGEIQGLLQVNPTAAGSNTGNVNTTQVPDDGRLITSLLTPIYVRQTGIQVLTEHGAVRFNVTEQEIEAYGDGVNENTLISQQGKVTLYKLVTGEYQLNIGPDSKGHVEVHMITQIPTRVAARADFNVYDIHRDQ